MTTLIRACIISPRAGTGSEADPYRPKLADDYQGIAWRDITGVNNWLDASGLPFVLLAWCNKTGLDMIELDPNYRLIYRADLAKPTAMMPQAAFEALQAWLSANKLSSEEAIAALGASASKRTRQQIADDLRHALKSLAEKARARGG